MLTKILFALFTLVGPLHADTYTTNLFLNKPSTGSLSWGPKINGDMDTIDAQLGAVALATTTIVGTSGVNKLGDTMTGGLVMSNSSITLTGTNGYIKSVSSVTASAFFGNGAGLTGVLGSGAVLKTGDTMTGSLTLTNSSVTTTGTNGYATIASSVNASAFFAYPGEGRGLSFIANDLTSAGGSAGEILLRSGNGINNPRLAGNIDILSGYYGGASSNTVTIAGGLATGNADGGMVRIKGGNAQGSYNGGDVHVSAGLGLASGISGNVNIESAGAPLGAGPGKVNVLINGVNRIKIDTVGVTISTQLVVASSVNASGFFGNGSGLTGVCRSSETDVPAVAAFTNTAFGVAIATVTMTTRGHPVTLGLLSTVQITNLASNNVLATILIDSSFSSDFGNRSLVSQRAPGLNQDFDLSFNALQPVLAAGSHSFALTVAVTGGTGAVICDATHHCQFYVRECAQ